MCSARVNFLNSGDDSLDFSFEEGIIPDHGSFIVKFVLFDKFLNYRHELVLIGLGLLKILLHKLNFHINGFDSFLFIGR
jgi:hypothetical protein